MAKNKKEIVILINNLIEVRDNIFTQIVNLSMSGEFADISSTFEVGEKYNFELSHFKNSKNVNVKKLVSLCKKAEQTIFTLININGLDGKQFNL
ncbi:hypothetical protein [Flavobacterium psychrophilum]|uniref:hypothetical protein n=1 Tax=Flavobacterium psychrophilum TaxID=96345 RepID=UPI00106C7617|nr:hypothetical protein [Flavobacterium psychrophilum]